VNGSFAESTVCSPLGCEVGAAAPFRGPSDAADFVDPAAAGLAVLAPARPALAGP
jgi:hypothetical protein